MAHAEQDLQICNFKASPKACQHDMHMHMRTCRAPGPSNLVKLMLMMYVNVVPCAMCNAICLYSVYAYNILLVLSRAMCDGYLHLEKSHESQN